MASKPNEKEPTQTTDKGLEIPVPTREDWDATLDKLIKPVRPKTPADETDDG